MGKADALLSGRLTRRTMTWLLVAMLIVTPVEASSTGNHLILWSLPLRAAILAANLWAVRTRRLSPINSGRIFLIQGVLTTTGWSLLLGSGPMELVFQCTAYGSILSIWALLMAPQDQRTWWSLSVVGVVMAPAAAKLLPGNPLLFAQAATILVVHSLALAMLDVHANRVESESRMASIDPLTGLLNRRPTRIRLQEQLSATVSGLSTASLLILDLDHFKQLNDTLGHEAGDDALRGVAETLTALAASDDLVCRWGGEEFLVLLAETGEAAATRAGDQFRTAIAQTGVTVSIGVTEVRPTDSVTTWVARADRAMYAAKDQGRDRVVAAPSDDGLRRIGLAG